jgi:prepilin-type processing-associated H-X9-DG protein
MRKRKILTKIDVIVITIILLFLAAIFMPRLGYDPKIANRVVCGTNLKGLGTAMTVYAEDYDGRFPELPGEGPWSKSLGFAYDLEIPKFSQGDAQYSVGRTITASWYLLVREADVSPKLVVCPAEKKEIRPYDGKNPTKRNLFELWDFGNDPYKHVSYAMHNPYGAFPAGGLRSASFAVAADTGPWMHMGEFVNPDSSNKDWKKNVTLLPPYFSDPTVTRESMRQANAMAHDREGQNVMYADGHAEYNKTPDTGIKHDNIYTYWSVTDNPTEKDKRIGTYPTSRSVHNDAKSKDDSFLAL